jgi:hypothetical protein
MYIKLYNKFIKKYLWLIAIIIFSIVILRILTYKVNEIEGFKGPQFKKKDKKYEIDKFANPLSNFGFKYSKEENFNNTGKGNSSDSTQNALDEADRLDVNSLSVNNMKSILHNYNKNITEQLEDNKDDNNLINVMNQGKVFVNEFKKLFDIGLFI